MRFTTALPIDEALPALRDALRARPVAVLEAPPGAGKTTRVPLALLDEPWLRQDPQAARRIAVQAIDRALEGLKATTVVHLCFGYAAVVKGEKPVGYSFLGELGACRADQISIEAAQPKLDLGVLGDLAPKKIMLGVIDLADPQAETAAIVANRIRAALDYLPPERLVPAPDCGMKYLPRELAFVKLKALADGAAQVRAELA